MSYDLHVHVSSFFHPTEMSRETSELAYIMHFMEKWRKDLQVEVSDPMLSIVLLEL
jgi:hypothetical protein